MKRAWKDRVIVITGASSGIGRATALALAKKGAHVVLAARPEDPLEDLARECEASGVRTLVVPTEVSDAAAVRHLAAESVRAFGHFDAWVNNAGVYLMGSLEETPDDAFRQLMETNFFGTVSGTRAALTQFRHQGYGTLVNVASTFGAVTAPYASAYIASKHAVRGFSASVRQEFLNTGIDVCTVLPAAIDTPLWQHTANYTGWAIRPGEPVYTPERVADAILRVLHQPRPEVFVGPTARAFERTMHGVTGARHSEKKRQRSTSGSLFRPMYEGTGTSIGSHARRKPWLRRLLFAGGLAAAAVSLRKEGAGWRLGGRVATLLGV
ncbi:MAG TPA: SDR family NAD(P)-dependent oxidoreductase [Myxococcus sp.]|nr:SDR family NAD(P)-dependent oxidoreductase [Myxococcus sp.]